MLKACCRNPCIWKCFSVLYRNCQYKETLQVKVCKHTQWLLFFFLIAVWSCAQSDAFSLWNGLVGWHQWRCRFQFRILLFVRRSKSTALSNFKCPHSWTFMIVVFRKSVYCIYIRRTSIAIAGLLQQNWEAEDLVQMDDNLKQVWKHLTSEHEFSVRGERMCFGDFVLFSCTGSKLCGAQAQHWRRCSVGWNGCTSEIFQWKVLSAN